MSVCSNCGTKNEDKNIYCYYCNKEISPTKGSQPKGETDKNILRSFHPVLIVVIICVVGFLLYFFLLRNDIKVSQLELKANPEEANSKIVSCSFYNNGRRNYEFVTLEIDLLDGSGNTIRHHICTISDLGPQMKKDMKEVIFTTAQSAIITKVIKDPPGIQGMINLRLNSFIDKLKSMFVKVNVTHENSAKPDFSDKNDQQNSITKEKEDQGNSVNIADEVKKAEKMLNK